MFQLSSQKDDLGSSSCPRPAVKSLHVSIWDSPLISFTSFDLGQCFCPLPVLMLLSYLHTRLPLHLPAMLLQSALLYKCSVPDIKPRRKKSSISTQIYDYVAITIANRPRTLFIRCVWARDCVCVRVSFRLVCQFLVAFSARCVWLRKNWPERVGYYLWNEPLWLFLLCKYQLLCNFFVFPSFLGLFVKGLDVVCKLVCTATIATPAGQLYYHNFYLTS